MEVFRGLQLPRAHAQLGRHLRQPLAALQQPLTACALNSRVKLRRVRFSAIVTFWGV